jgi:hypothetical protein
MIKQPVAPLPVMKSTPFGEDLGKGFENMAW